MPGFWGRITGRRVRRSGTIGGGQDSAKNCSTSDDDVKNVIEQECGGRMAQLLKQINVKNTLEEYINYLLQSTNVRKFIYKLEEINCSE